MLWKALRPAYWILDRKVRSKRYTVISMILLLGLGGQWLYNRLAPGLMDRLGSEMALNVVAALLPNLLFLFLMFALLGLGDLLYQLYEAPDLELLLAAPVPLRTVYLVKLLQSSQVLVIPTIVFSFVLAALGAAQGSPAAYYPLSLATLMGLVLLVSSTLLLFVLLISRWLPAQRARQLLPWALLVFSVLVLSAQTPLMNWFMRLPGLVPALQQILLQPWRLGFLATILSISALAMTAAGYTVFNHTFIENRERLFLVSQPTRRLTRTTIRRQTTTHYGNLGNWLTKEWLELRRNSQAVLNLAQPLVVVLVVFAPLLGQSAQALLPLMYWFLVFYLVFFLAMQPLGGVVASLLGEGAQMELLRSLPTSMGKMLWGKLVAALAPAALTWVLVLLASGWALGYAFWQAAVLAGLALWGMAGVYPLELALAAQRANFKGEQANRRLKSLDGYLVMTAGMVYMLLSTAFFTWCVVRLFPKSSEVRVLGVLQGYGGLDWLFAPGWGTALGLLSGIALAWVLIFIAWRTAVQHLESWEGI